MRGRFDNIVADVATIRGALKLQEDHATLGGNVTLADEDAIISAYDAGGSSRNVTLPARANTNDGTVRLVVNLSTAGENLVIKNAAATTLLTLPSGGVALVLATGTAEAPGTQDWIAVPIGGEDLALADDLTITGDLAVTGNTSLNGKVALGNAVTDSVGMYGVSQTAQPANASQSAIPTTVITSVASTSLTALDVDRINAGFARIEEIRVLITEIRAAGIAVGWMKGSA